MVFEFVFFFEVKFVTPDKYSCIQTWNHKHTLFIPDYTDIIADGRDTPVGHLSAAEIERRREIESVD